MVRRVERVERDAQQAFLTPGQHAAGDVQEGRREQLPVLHDADLPRLLDDEQACRVPRRRGEIHRTGEPARHDGNEPRAVARRWRPGRGSVTAPEQHHNSEGSGQRLVAGHLGPSNMGPLKLRAVIWAPLPAGPLENRSSCPPVARCFGCASANSLVILPPIVSRSKSATVLAGTRSEEHTSELQSQSNLVCRLLLEKKKIKQSQ